MKKIQISKLKSQINFKAQIPKGTAALDFGFWNLFGICNLDFGIF
jgi:hypothetical protein